MFSEALKGKISPALLRSLIHHKALRHDTC